MKLVRRDDNNYSTANMTSITCPGDRIYVGPTCTEFGIHIGDFGYGSKASTAAHVSIKNK